MELSEMISIMCKGRADIAPGPLARKRFMSWQVYPAHGMSL